MGFDFLDFFITNYLVEIIYSSMTIMLQKLQGLFLKDDKYVYFSPPTVVPLLISVGPSKPTNLDFLKTTIQELEFVRLEGVTYKKKVLKVIYYSIGAFSLSTECGTP